jgi:hypothetical protein
VLGVGLLSVILGISHGATKKDVHKPSPSQRVSPKTTSPRGLLGPSGATLQRSRAKHWRPRKLVGGVGRTGVVSSYIDRRLVELAWRGFGVAFSEPSDLRSATDLRMKLLWKAFLRRSLRAIAAEECPYRVEGKIGDSIKWSGGRGFDLMGRLLVSG